MQAEIITIGDEILIGQIVDSNSAFISQHLNKIGISVYQITSVQDDRTHILKALKEAEANADVVVITGGLGPTKDDITKKTIAEYFNDTLKQDDTVLENIKEMWKRYVRQELTQVNIDQALVPTRSTTLMNRYGSAPGMWLEQNNTIFIAMPGVPFEMQALMSNEVIPRLQQRFKLPYILHRTLMTYGLGESMIAHRLKNFEDNLPEFIKLAYLPNLGKVRLRLSAKGKDKDNVNQEMSRQIKALLPLIKDIFVGFEHNHSLEELIGKQLSELGQTLSTAESCTGGKIAEQLTAFSGASNFFKGGLVSYATESKINLLSVDSSLIEAHSVVSSQVAEAMAIGVKNLFNTDYGISTTGNAGPTKGDSDAEVGTVFIAIATPSGVFSEEFHLGNHRTKVINKAVNKALELFEKEILKKLIN